MLESWLQATKGYKCNDEMELKGHVDCPRRKVPDKSQGQTSTNQQPVARQTDGREGAKIPANQEKPTWDKRPIRP